MYLCTQLACLLSFVSLFTLKKRIFLIMASLSFFLIFYFEHCTDNDTPLLRTLQAIYICLSTSRSAHHYKRRRNWGCLAKLFNTHYHLSKFFWDWANIKFARWRTLTTWRWLSGYKRTILQHPEATWRTLGDEVHGSGASSHSIPPPTFKPGE